MVVIGRNENVATTVLLWDLWFAICKYLSDLLYAYKKFASRDSKLISRDII